jgi:chromosome segregation ATPase
MADEKKDNFGDEELNPQEEAKDLLKKFRNAESDRKAYAEDAKANFQKQRNLIDKLKSENNVLKEYIGKMNTQQVAMTQTVTSKNANVEFLVEDYKGRIEGQKEKIGEIETHIIAFQQKIVDHKESLGGVNFGAENQNALVKQIKILENRLDKANQKFNEAIALNKNLRQQIDSLRRERVIFDNLYKKLEKELHEKRKKMANIIESANSAYEERDNANERIQGLKQQAKREAEDFEKELKELSQIMEKNKKTLDYIKMTEKNREDTQVMTEPDANDKSRTRAQKFINSRNSNTVNLERIQKFEEELAKIQAATQITDFDKLVSIFKKNEEKNFQMFKYANELSNEIESLEKAIADLKEEKSKYEGAGSSTDVTKKKMLKDLEETLSKLEHKSEQYEFKYHDSVKIINSLCNWIESLYNTIDCDKIAPRDFASNQGVTESNMMSYLGVIEDRSNDIVASYATMAVQQQQKSYEMLDSKGFMSMNSIAKGRNESPDFAAEDMSGSDGEGEKPLTLEEFKLKARDKIESKKTLHSGKIKKGSSKLKKKM